MYFGITQLSLSALVASSVASPLLKRAFPASQADYDDLRRSSKLASAAYISCFPTAFDVTVTHEINNIETDTQGFVGYSDTKKSIVVSMRGSTSSKDFENDGNVNETYPALSGVAFPSDVRVMEGVYQPWASVHEEVLTEVRRLIALYPDYTLESTGHSLGGALTYFSYIALAQNFPEKNLTSNALAAFPIGNQAFADFGTAQKGLIRRGNNKDDGVPNVNPQFVHFGIEFYGNGTAESTVQCEGQRDPACSAGNGQSGITLGHLSSFGIPIIVSGCADVIPNTTTTTTT